MVNRIRTTHVGSLPRTKELLAANLERSAGTISQEEFHEILRRSVEDVVQRQVDLGIDILNEGEYGHVTSGAVDYGAWWNYSFTRLGGLTMTDKDRWEIGEQIRSEPGKVRLSSMKDRRDRALFAEAYNDPDSGIFTGRKKVANPEFSGPVTYIGQDQVNADVTLLKDAMAKAGAQDGFVAALSPGAAARLPNKYYEEDIDLVRACG
ncbi:MAG: epoxyalkane--coenzyme M transferase, partial [Corynebacterium flavescens]|nr:epoxyalkane--coenzyme M transferase [Corynebacterium flavescens]MDN6532447.1 epoxyalkane--coenzyme M transferase [Corynebacterium flavescens]MDN6647108.1 epoxyalkane--coenzyme M transferase [Corynebacterium flavescens]